MTKKAKAYELRSKSKQQLADELKAYKTELQQLRVDKVAKGAPSKLMKINVVRKNVAIVHTVTKQLERDAIRKSLANKKYIPLDLRKKQTRAIRRLMTPLEAGKKTIKQAKKDKHFPKVAYSVKQ